MNDIGSPELRIAAAGGRTIRPGQFDEPHDDPGYLASLEADADGHGQPHRTKAPVTLNIVNPVDLAFRPVPPREWIVEDWLPIGCVTALYGDGGVGKSLLAQQLMTSTAIEGQTWCGRQVMPCRSFALFCEDDEAELHRRQAAICAAYGVGIEKLDAMRWVSGVGSDNSLMTFDREGGFVTPLYDAVKAATIEHQARLLILDTAADLFPGNENDRHQVRVFIGQLNALAIAINGAVLLNAHPSRTGLSTGNLDGGSTAWSNSVRSRWTLAKPEAEEGAEPDADARILTKRKANYARTGDDIALRWINGTLAPSGVVTEAAGAPYRAQAETVFLELLAARWEQNIFVSHGTRAGNFAPKVFAKMADRKGYTAKDFEAAMNRLLDTKRIVAETYGRKGDMRQRIAIVDEPKP